MADQVCSSGKCQNSCGQTDIDAQKVKDEMPSSKGGVFCKCGEGWSCVITKIDEGAPDSGKIFFKCGEGCSCEIGSGEDYGTCALAEVGVGGSDVYCKCGDGWSCVIMKTDDKSKFGKAFAECGDGCCITTAA